MSHRSSIPKFVWLVLFAVSASLAQSGSRNSATVTLHELAHRVPKRAEKEFSTAMKASSRDDQEHAILHLRNAVSIDPEFYSAVNNLGALYLIMDQLDLASEQFEKAIAVDPRMPWAYANLALTYLRRGDYRQGERAARQSVAMDSSCIRGMLLLGMALVVQNKFTAEAERILQRAAFDFPQAKFWLGIVSAAKGDIHAAESQLTAYIGSGDKNTARIDAAADLMRRIAVAAHNNQDGRPITVRFGTTDRDTF
jgi:tetratricopeptide (TPR) repeat protein